MSLHILGLSWLDEDARYATNNDVTSENGIMISYRQWLFLLNAAQCTAKATKEPNAANHQGCVCFLAGLARGLSEKQESSARRPVAASAGSNLQHESQIHSHPSECSVSANETSSSPSSVSKDARTDSHSETGNKTVAQDIQTERPAYETLRSLDGTIHQGVKMDAQPDTLSEQARLDLLKFAVQMVIDEYPRNEINSQTMEGFYSFLCRLARGEDASPDGSSHQENNDDTLKDCTETAEKTVAQPAFELSVEELLQINKGFIPEELKLRALNELKRRTGECEASS